MDKHFKELVEEAFEKVTADVELYDGLVRSTIPGHTKEVEFLDCCYSGCTTALYYSVGTVIGKFGIDIGTDIIKAIQLLQVTDPNHPQYGGFRWYREETRINDTNAAFFTLMPLAVLRLFYPEKVSPKHIPILDEIFDKGLEWFVKECKNPALFYPNKIISDGALLLALSSIRGKKSYYQEGISFFERWNEYTDRRGWGWGENMSIGYLGVILNSLSIACKALSDRSSLKEKLEARIEYLFNYKRFHDGYEFVPTIRSYNFEGRVTIESPLWYIAGIKENIFNEFPADLEQGLGWLNTILIFKDKFISNNKMKACSTGKKVLPVPRIRRERIFDDTYAYSWIGKNGRLGSLTRFPSAPGSYQMPPIGHGLGWQSFPVNLIVDNEQVSFIRWLVKERGNVRMHPTENKAKTYLSPALFGETIYPKVETRCTQNENVVIVVRSISNISNQAEEISDEWVVKRFRGEVETFTGKGQPDRKWVILNNANTVVAITALKGIPYSEQKRTDMGISIQEEEGNLRLRQILYCGQEKVIHHPRLETGWVIYYIDEGMEKEKIYNLLNNVEITDESKQDGEVPRTSFNEIREISLKLGDRQPMYLKIDPYDSL